MQANLYLRDAAGIYQSQGVLFSETGADPIHAVAMSPTVIALGMPSGLHVFRRNSMGAFVPFAVSSQPKYLRLEIVGTMLRVYVNDVLLLERSDATFARGSSGFAMFNTVASYDDYIAYQP